MDSSMIQLRLFLGLMINPPHPNQKKKADEAVAEVEKEDEVSDDEIDGDDEDDDEDDEDEAGASRIVELEDSGMTREEEIKMERMLVFLEDPDKAMKIFFSSYFQEKGLMWYVNSFILVLIAHRVLIRAFLGLKPSFAMDPSWLNSSSSTSSVTVHSQNTTPIYERPPLGSIRPQRNSP